MRISIIVANWKMNKSVSEAVRFVQELHSSLTENDEIEVVIAPPFTSLNSLSEKFKDSPIKLAAQNVFCMPDGPFTGEISPRMLKDVGCDYVIIGHSERRDLFNESDEMIHAKIVAAIKNDLIPILCVGERLQELRSGQTEAVLARQLDSALQGLRSTDVERLVIAYEPVWAIGTGETASPEDAQVGALWIRKRIQALFSAKISNGVWILYGGSVNPENAKELLAQRDIDGALVGGSSLDPKAFLKIIQTAVQAKRNK
ncbi:triose-phosphate isomerase [Candidatus Acetothermia bacterium]|nr:triose-phosphate isomerase [Candidatus Acetothermia bacterium]MBI3643227.1 triose-phosphate isomerase [Candidatus Acetothermia bacterium]